MRDSNADMGLNEVHIQALLTDVTRPAAHGLELLRARSVIAGDILHKRHHPERCKQNIWGKSQR
jgi:hypothetical protein